MFIKVIFFLAIKHVLNVYHQKNNFPGGMCSSFVPLNERLYNTYNTFNKQSLQGTKIIWILLIRKMLETTSTRKTHWRCRNRLWWPRQGRFWPSCPRWNVIGHAIEVGFGRVLERRVASSSWLVPTQWQQRRK